jgi:hypothetical protein
VNTTAIGENTGLTVDDTDISKSRATRQREESITRKYFDRSVNTKMQFFRMHSTHEAEVTVEALNPNNLYSRTDSKDLNFHYGILKSNTYDNVLYDSILGDGGRWKKKEFDEQFTNVRKFKVLPIGEYSTEDIHSKKNPDFTYAEKDVIGFWVGYKCGRYGQYSHIMESGEHVKKGKMKKGDFYKYFP